MYFRANWIKVLQSGGYRNPTPGSKKPPPQRRLSHNWACYFFAASAFAAASALPASDLAYLRRKRSTRPAVSTSFCLPVKKGWHLEQISTRILSVVEAVTNSLPQAQRTVVFRSLG